MVRNCYFGGQKVMNLSKKSIGDFQIQIQTLIGVIYMHICVLYVT